MENTRKIFTNQEVAKILENVAAAIEILEEDQKKQHMKQLRMSRTYGSHD